MLDLRRYWQEVRTLERALPDFVWLMGLEDPLRRLSAGGPVEVPAARAAQLLHDKSHRAATDKELADHLALTPRGSAASVTAKQLLVDWYR